MQKLLVIDDSLTVRKLVELSFREAGWSMDFAVSGGEGISKALAGAPDLVLLDYVLPDMKATEVCERLIASRHAASPSIILMSAKMERVRELFRPFPMVVDFVGKPFTSAEITALCARALARSVPANTASVASPAPASAAASAPSSFSFKQKEAAANAIFQRLRRELAHIPEWTRQLGAAPPAAFFARKLITPDAVDGLLEALLPLYREILAQAPARAHAHEPRVDEPSLQGQISAWPLRDLFHVLHGSGRTGELWIFHGAQTVISYWQGGEVILVTSQDPTDYARGAPLALFDAPADEVERAEVEQRGTGKPFYLGLHERGHLPACDLDALLEQQGRRVLEEVLAARAARFVWRERASLPSWVESHGVHMGIEPALEASGSGVHTIAQLTLERMRRPSSWAESEAHLAGPEAVYARTTAFSAKLAKLRLSANEQRVLTVVDGKVSLTAIADRTGIAAKEVARILLRLSAVDLIAAPVHRERGSSRRGPRPVMILEPDREGFHTPLRTLLMGRPEPLELVDLAGEPDLIVAITREHPALVIINDAACDANVSDVARAIRAMPQLANVSLAAVLESRAKAKMDDLAAAGFDAVLVKPVLYSDLSKLIASSFLAAPPLNLTREGENHEDSRRG